MPPNLYHSYQSVCSFVLGHRSNIPPIVRVLYKWSISVRSQMDQIHKTRPQSQPKLPNWFQATNRPVSCQLTDPRHFYSSGNHCTTCRHDSALSQHTEHTAHCTLYTAEKVRSVLDDSCCRSWPCGPWTWRQCWRS